MKLRISLRARAGLSLIVLGVLSAGSALACTDGSCSHDKVMAAQAGAVKVQGAWLRPAVKGQSGTGGYMRLTSARDLTLLGFSVSTRLGKGELHEMSMDGDVMRMREIESLPLPAGRTVELRPGAHHLMLTGLQRGLKTGEKIEVELRLKDAAGKTFTQAVAVPVLTRAPAVVAAKPASAGHDHHDHHDHDH